MDKRGPDTLLPCPGSPPSDWKTVGSWAPPSFGWTAGLGRWIQGRSAAADWLGKMSSSWGSATDYLALSLPSWTGCILTGTMIGA